MIDLKRQLYSQYCLEQKEYGKITNILKSKYNKSIDKGIKFTRKLHKKKIDEINELSPIENKRLGIKLVKEANKKGIRVFDKDNARKIIGNVGKDSGKIKDGGNFIDLGEDVSKETKETIESVLPLIKPIISKNDYRMHKKVLNELGKNRKLINLKTDYYKSNPTLAHEIGHRMNKDSKSRFEKKVSELYNNPNSKITGNSKSIMNKIKDVYNTGKNSIVTSLEERNAWKNGIKLMKKNGASKEEIKIAKRRAKLGVSTYDLGNSEKLLNKLKIK